jgi:hypothetical protein
MPAGLDRIGILALDRVAADPVLLLVALEERADRVVCRHLVEVDHCRPDRLLVDPGTIALAGDVALGLGHHSEEARLRVVAQNLPGQLDDPAGVLDDLDRLDAGDVVEEPAAARVHEHGVALKLEQLACSHLLLIAQLARRVPGPESLLARRRAVSNDRDVVVAGRPRVAEEIPRPLLEPGRQLIAQPIEGLPQRGPPGLVPVGVSARVAAAVAPPAVDAVDAAPGGAFEDLGLVSGLVSLEVLTVDGEVSRLVPLDGVDGGCQGHVSIPVVVTVALSIGGDVNELRPVARTGERPGEAIGKALAVGEQSLEGHASRDRPIIEEDDDRAARGELHQVGHRRIDPGAAHVPPATADRPHTPRLARSQDGEADPLPGEDLKALQVRRRLREPHPLWLAPEALLEIADPPDHLGLLVAPVGQGEDHVVIDLGEGGAMTGEVLPALTVGFQDRLVGARGSGLHPGEKGRPEVEADPRVVVDDLLDPMLVIEHAGGTVGCVALGCDPLVPIMVGIGRVLKLDRLEPGVLSRWLVEMTMQTDVSLHQPSSCLIR